MEKNKIYKIGYINPLPDEATELFVAKKYQTVDNINDADAIMIRSTKIHDLKLATSVIAMGRAGVGVNTIPFDRFGKEGVVVFNTPGGNSNAVKEMTIAALILAKRNLLGSMRWVNDIKDDNDLVERVEREKSQFAGLEISNKTLGVIGLGAIGGQVATEAVNLGMEVYGYDPYISVDHAWGLPKIVHRVRDLNELLSKCDYITVHVPLKEDTHHMINAESFKCMRKGVAIINYARGGIIDEVALKDALEDGTVCHYVTDFPNPEVVKMKNVTITPHLGGSTLEAENNCAVMAVNSVIDYLETGSIRNSVNYPDCYAGEIDGVARVTINHLNVPNMLSQFTTVFGNASSNIRRLINNSKNELAYSIIDLDKDIDQDSLEKLNKIPGVLRVRILYKQL